MHLDGTRAGWIGSLNDASLAARPWRQPGYRYRPSSPLDPQVHRFRTERPYYGWVHGQVDTLDFAMFSANDDGVAAVYHAFGPDSYEAASVAIWAELARAAKAIGDVGAFTGLYAILAQLAAPEAKVFAVEPNSAARARLFTNLVANGFYPGLTVFPLAVSDRAGPMTLLVAWGPDILDTGASLTKPLWHTAQMPTRTEIVTAAPLDAIVARSGCGALDLLKIDVEGTEDMVLAGAEQTLAAGPTLFLEIRNAGMLEACWPMLSGQGYTLHLVDDDRLSLVRFDGGPIGEWFDRHVGRRIMNFLCVARDGQRQLAERGLARIRAKLG